MRSPVNPVAAPLALLVLLAGCGLAGKSPPPALAQAAPLAGPAADYPMVLGAPFTVDGVSYTPADTMNYDQVGHAAIGDGGGAGVTGAHRTLPLPSYVEVTALASGKTILARLERRGPMSGASLIELSPGAAEQLGLGARGPVRVRRVNPPEAERAALRAGGRAPERMETPKPLLAVLMRKLDPAASPLPPKSSASPVSASIGSPVQAIDPDMPLPAPTAKAAPAVLATKAATPDVSVAAGTSPFPLYKPPAKTPLPAAAPKPAAAVAAGDLVIQAGAYSARTRADSAARAIGGKVTAAGALWRVRTGPFTSRAAAEAALAQVRRAGYSDARIQRAD